MKKRAPKARSSRSNVLYFFDTNFLCLPPENLPLIKHVPARSRWVTETVRQEVIDELGPMGGRRVLGRRFRTLTFNDLYRNDPGICPVFYWYVVAMVNAHAALIQPQTWFQSTPVADTSLSCSANGSPEAYE